MTEAQQGSAQQTDFMSKAEFARHVGVHRSRVSHWIKEGKIFGEAIVGEGPTAQICVSLAKAQLRRAIDIGQRFGNGISTKLDDPPATLDAHPEAQASLQLGPASTRQPAAAPSDSIEEQIKRERLETLKRQNRRAAEEDALQAGRYVLAEDARRQMGRIASGMISHFEEALSDLASDVAAHFGLQQRDVLHRMRGTFRSIRERRARQASEDLNSVPEFIEDNLAPAGEDADDSAAEQ